MNLRCLLPLGLVACSTATPMEPDHPDPSAAAVIGAPCAMDPVLPPHDRFPAPKVYTEVAIFRAPPGYLPPPGARSHEAILRDPRLSLVQGAHIMSGQDEMGVMDTTSLAGPAHSRITIQPHLSFTPASAPRVRVSVSVEDSELGTARGVVDVSDQQPTFIAEHGLVIVVTPYVIRGMPDVKRLYECRATRSPRVSSP